MRYFSVLAAALILAACSTTPGKPAAKAPLDGKTFTALVTRDGKTETDELVFRNGTFVSADNELAGFAPAKYSAVKEGEFMKFEAVATSPKAGTIKWTGKVHDEAIEGTAVWDKTWWQPNREYTFRGKEK